MRKTSGKSAASVARDFGIDSGLLNRWKREEAQEDSGKKAFPGQGNPRDEELFNLRKEIADLRETNEILKKSSCYLLREGKPEMSYRFMADHLQQWSVEKMARVLAVSTSDYYAWRKRPVAARGEKDRALVEQIRAIQKRHRRRYGSPRVWQELKNQGMAVGHNRVARLMRLHDLMCKKHKKFQITNNSRHTEPVAENILDRQFDVALPNTALASDITSLPTKDGWLYLCVVIDLFDRQVVGWSMRTDMTATLVIDASFMMAVVMKRPPGALVFHSERGQYCSMACRT